MASIDVIEIIRGKSLPRRIRAVMFDWDGTLSLLREGWSSIMTTQLTRRMQDSLPAMTDEVRTAAIESIVVGLNGRPTIVQMQSFSDLVRNEGGPALRPNQLLNEYEQLLFAVIGERYRAIEADSGATAAWRVPGALAFLQFCRDKRLPVIVISGTRLDHVRTEAKMLQLDSLVDIWHAPIGDDPDFSKRVVIHHLADEFGIDGSEFLAFGDGVVETEEIRRVNGIAVAVATCEPPQRGINPAKRERLIQAGAEAVIAGYDQHAHWWPLLVSGG